MGEYINPVDQIKKVLLKFQEGYSKKALDKLNEFIDELFVMDEDISFASSGVNDWYFGIDGVKEILKSHWTNEEKFMSNIELDIDNSQITIDENTALVTLKGNSKQKLEENKLHRRVIEQIKNRLNEQPTTPEELMKNSIDISRVLFEANLGENFIWPFRFTSVLVCRNSRWFFKHVKISFGAGNGYETRIIDEDFDKSYITLSAKNKASVDTEEIVKVLEKLQEAYKKRNITLAEQYAGEIFTNSEDMLIYGTDEGENFYGADAGRRLMELDWTYWGNFDLNIHETFISVLDNMAWVSSKALLRMMKDPQTSYDSLKNLFLNYLLPSDKSTKEILLTMLWKTSKRVYEAQRGYVYIVPMKFSGVLIKKDGRWRFQHMHFSDNIDGMPEERK
jgi:hypothetical protein